MTEQRPNEQSQRKLAERLTEVLADSYLLYHTTQSCHWNVVGEQFRPLHEMFEEQYRALAEAIDVIAERIRILGFHTPGTLGDYVALSEFEQPTQQQQATHDMLEHLITGHETVSARIQQAIPVAKELSDEATLDLLIERQRAHQKANWMLKSQAGHRSKHLEPSGLKGRRSAANPELVPAGGV